MAYTPRPYVRPAYEPDTRTLQELMRMAGESRARQAALRGQNTAQGLFTLGQILSQGLGGIRQDREQRQLMEAAAAKQQRDDAFKLRDQQLREADLLARMEEREQARQDKQAADAYKRGGEVAEEVGYGPMSESQLESVMQGPAAGRARYIFGPGTAEGPELQPTKAQQRGIDAEKAIQGMGGTIGPNGQVVMPPKPEREPNPTEASLAMMAARGDASAARALERLRALRAPQQSANEPLVAVMGDDGVPVMLPRSQAVGRRPASTREQGRAVTSGDAGRIADLDTSMDDLDVLDDVLVGSGSTGTSAKVGAMLPNWVSELTGRGISAKQKQATIERVKQVIGKALEGGVLRKEDEKKYEKILPTIYDPPSVVTTKLSGLQTALEHRRQTLIDALSDAGYDVSRFERRTRATSQVDDPVDALIKKYGGG